MCERGADIKNLLKKSVIGFIMAATENKVSRVRVLKR